MAEIGPTQEHAEKILAQYPELGGGIEQLVALPQCLFNENVKLVVAGKSYVLKKMTAGRSVDRHRYGAKLQNILTAQGFPCPQVICNQNDDEISSYGGALWSVQTWAKGSYCPPKLRSSPNALQVMDEVGATLGQFHSLSREALGQGALPIAPEEARLTFSEKILRIGMDYRSLFSRSQLRLSQAMRLRLRPWKSSSDRETITQMSILKEGCQQLLNWDFSRYPSLEDLGPCHGDINWENLLFHQGKLSAVLDFDNAMEMNQTYDAAAAAAVICTNDSKHLETFLTAYEKTSGNRLDHEILPKLMLMKYVKSLLFQTKLVLSNGTRNDELAASWRRLLANNIKNQII